MGNLLTFKSKTWSPFETALRHSLVTASKGKGIGMKEHLISLVTANSYPEHFETPFKIHTILTVLFPAEIKKFEEDCKGKFNTNDPMAATSTYFLRTMETICKSYGINMLEVAKGKK